MTREDATTVLVVGAGPVGLLTALQLTRRGIETRIVDPDRLTKNFSYGLALHPSTLELLDEAGVASDVIARSLVVNRIAFYDGANRAGELRTSELPGRFPFLVTLPQSVLEQVLETKIRAAGGRVTWSRRAAEMRTEAGGATVRVDHLDDVGTGYPYMRFERTVTASSWIRARFVVGADGYHSFVRESMHEEYRSVGPRETYCVFEFEAAGGEEAAREMAVVFHGTAVNVLWPLPGNRWRWSFQVAENENAPLTSETLLRLMKERAPWYRADIREINWRAIVEFEPRLVKRFATGTAWLAGDAAHLTGPVGVQSMNVGLREGRDVAEAIATMLGGARGASASVDTSTAEAAAAAYAKARSAEWNRLLRIEGAVEARTDAPGWARERRERMLSLVPSAGRDLATLLGHIGLTWTP